MVERVDRGVGQILRALDRLKLAGQTIVIFTNDNGGEWLSSNAPLLPPQGDVCGRAAFASRPCSAGQADCRAARSRARWASRWICTRRSSRQRERRRLKSRNSRASICFPILEGRAPMVERTLFWRWTSPARTQRAVRSGDWKVVVEGTGVPGARCRRRPRLQPADRRRRTPGSRRTRSRTWRTASSHCWPLGRRTSTRRPRPTRRA